jgi:phosphate-selective porin OprO/OprP
MRILLLAGASLLALSTTALAQEGEDVPATDSSESPIDTLVPAEAGPAAVAAPAPTGDPILDRLNLLEARVKQLEARNAQLEQQNELNEGRLQSVETRSAKAVQFSWAPTLSEPTSSFTFKPRGVIEFDAVAFLENKGGHDYNNGTGFRRARLGFEGTAFKYFPYRIEVDFAGNAVSILDAYLQYTKIPKTVLTLGQHKAPFGLESNNSDNYNNFLERGMFTNAFGAVGAERRIGFSAAYAPKETINIAVGAFGDNESVTRSSGAPVTDTPDESWGFNGRATWEPIFDTGKILHLGAAGYYRTALKVGDVQDAVRLSDRPNIRVDNGNIADTGSILGVESVYYAGAEAAAVFGPLTLAGEVGRLWLNRPDASDEHFTGFYGYASYFLTGETRPFRGGNFDRVRPLKELGKDGLGAFELAVRYDQLNLGRVCRLAVTPVTICPTANQFLGTKAQTTTLGLNWYFNPFAKLMFNWVHFWGDNTPLDPIGTETKGDALASRLHLDF